jgi:hypothetical protein
MSIKNLWRLRHYIMSRAEAGSTVADQVSRRTINLPACFFAAARLYSEQEITVAMKLAPYGNAPQGADSF